VSDPGAEQQREDDRIAALLAGPRKALPEGWRAALEACDARLAMIAAMARPWEMLRREMRALLENERRKSR
jgi:hypothetical protein